MSQPVRVVVVDDHAMFRAGVRAELAAAGLERTHWWTDEAGDFGLSLSVK